MRCDDWPVFLVGCHRSGTTLARYLLDAHPNLACPPESKFLAGMQAFLDYPQAATALYTLGFPVEDVRREMRRLTETVLGGYAHRHGKRRWVDKTPNYYRLLPFLDDLFDEQVLYLFLVRHPLDCIGSLAECFDDATPEYDDPEIARHVARYGRDKQSWARFWTEVYEYCSSFAAQHPQRCLVFRYEDLVQRPQATLQQVLSFLGETLPPGLFATALTNEHTDGYQDHKIRATRAIHTASVGKWRTWPEGEVGSLWNVVGELALQFGYPAPQEQDHPCTLPSIP
jgi:hypothetical protein